jgi:hypothetical protein
MRVVVVALVIPVKRLGAERLRAAPQRVEIFVGGPFISDPSSVDGLGRSARKRPAYARRGGQRADA